MKRIQKVLFALAAVVALGLIPVTEAIAQVPFRTQGGLRIVRAEGRTEVVNAIDLIADPSAVQLREGTVITITYDGDITNNFTGDADSIDPFDLVECADGVGAALCSAILFANVTIDGSNLFIKIDDGDVNLLEDIAVTVDSRITVSGVRIDVAASGPGDISATITSSGDPANRRVTYSDPVVLVARARVSYEVDIEPSENDLLLCDPPEFPGFVRVVVTISEIFSSAFTTELQEAEAGIEDDAGVDINQGTVFRLRLSGVNAELTIDAAITDATAGLTPVLSDASIMSDGDDVDFEVSFAATDVGVTEEFEVTLDFYLDDGDDLDLETSTVNLGVQYDPVGDFDDDESEILLFADNGVDEDVFSINDCLSILLYNWLAYTGDGAYDSGLTISNTGDAPAELRTPQSQTGSCEVSFYKRDGSAPIVRPVGPLEPGQTGTLVVSSALGAPFTGYAIAVCHFQWGHGFSFISNPGGVGGNFAQGADAQVLTDRTPIAVESAGE